MHCEGKHEEYVITVIYVLTGTYSAVANQWAIEQSTCWSIFKGEGLHLYHRPITLIKIVCEFPEDTMNMNLKFGQRLFTQNVLTGNDYGWQPHMIIAEKFE